MRQSLSTNISGDASAGINGSTLDSAYIYSASATAVSTGTATGTVKFQASNDPPSILLKDSKGLPIPVNWVDIASQTVSVTAASKVMTPKFDTCYRWIRTVFVVGTGTGTIAVYVNTIGPS